ncbi:hypothetical protein ACWGA0_00555 [Streptomyces erythrochromogenes]
MTTTEPLEGGPGTALDAYLALIDEMLGGPFPKTDVHDATGWGGPGHRVRVLRVGRDLWNDDDGRGREESWTQMQARLDALVAAPGPCRGDPVVVDLGPYLVAGCNGEDVPEPLDSLSQQTVMMQAWPIPERDRWLGLSCGQADRELPFRLFAAVGAAGSLDLGADTP